MATKKKKAPPPPPGPDDVVEASEETPSKNKPPKAKRPKHPKLITEVAIRLFAQASVEELDGVNGDAQLSEWAIQRAEVFVQALKAKRLL